MSKVKQLKWQWSVMSTLIHTACADHEQLQEDEQWRDYEAEEQVTRMIDVSQFLAKQHLTHQLEAEDGEHPEQTQNRQPLLAFLIQADGDDGREVGAEAVCGEQRHEHQPPIQGGHPVHMHSHEHAEYKQRAKVEEKLEGGKAEPLNQLTQREQHGVMRLGLLQGMLGQQLTKTGSLFCLLDSEMIKDRMNQ